MGSWSASVQTLMLFCAMVNTTLSWLCWHIPAAACKLWSPHLFWRSRARSTACGPTSSTMAPSGMLAAAVRNRTWLRKLFTCGRGAPGSVVAGRAGLQHSMA